MFPQAATMTEAQKNEVIAWYSDMQRDAFEEGSESFLKVSSADGSPVGFCGWTVIGQKGEAIGGAKHERRKATWMPETLDQDSWIKLSHAPRAERNRVLKDFDDITREIIPLEARPGTNLLTWSLYIGLTFMAVSPEHQRQGIGSMMMQRVCEETDRHGRCAYVLAAPEGVRLYTKFGFETIGCVETAQGTDYEYALAMSRFMSMVVFILRAVEERRVYRCQGDEVASRGVKMTETLHRTDGNSSRVGPSQLLWTRAYIDSSLIPLFRYYCKLRSIFFLELHIYIYTMV